MKKLFVLILFVFSCVFVADAAIVVERSHNSNPTLKIVDRGTTETLYSEIERLLVITNWFEPTNAKLTDFVLEVAGDNLNLNYRLTSNGDVRLSARVTGINDDNKCAKIMVDALLRAVFNVEALCTSQIVFSGGKNISNRNIIITDIDSKNVNQLTTYKSLCVEPVFSPNGKSVIYSNYTNNNVNILESIISPKRTRILSSYRGLNIGAAISKNGRYLAMILSKDGQVDLYIKDLKANRLTRLTRNSAIESSPCFNSEGNLICYLSDKVGGPKLYVSNLNGSQVKVLPSTGTGALTPDWSSDNKIAYITNVSGDYRIAILDVNTGKNALVPNLTGKWESPSWAPDNRHIVCSRTLSPVSSTIYIIDTWTGKARRLFRGNGYYSTPNWSKGSNY